eukprot:c28338_g1_i2 orf=364-2457(+)
MSPMKQKSNEKSERRERKASSRQASASGGTSASAYNPSSGTFHTLEPVVLDSGASSPNGKSMTVNDIDDHSCLNGAMTEYDSLSNNGSCSGESEDQLNGNGKEKQGSAKLENPPGMVGGIDKRDKVRWKNERKHQRQRERRAQELRDRCTGYLMSRKLEVLAQQLVAMGFLPDQATMALILNDGHLEQSVSWLLEGGEGHVKEDWNTSGTLKIDISEELARITEIETTYKYARLEIERAIVSCEGDLDKAVELLQRRFQNSSPGRHEKKNLSSWGKDTAGNVQEQISLAVLSPSCTTGVIDASCASEVSQVLHQTRQEDRELNRSKGRLQVPGISFPYMERRPNRIEPPQNDSLVSSDLLRSSLPADARSTNEVRHSSSSQTSSQTYVSPIFCTADSSTDYVLQQHSNSSKTKPVHVASRVSVLSTQGFQSSHASLLTNNSMGVSSVPDSTLFCSPNWSGNFPLHSPSAGNMLGDLRSNGKMPSKQSLEGLGTSFVDSYGNFHPLLPAQLDSVGTGWISGRTGCMASDSPYSSSSLLSSGSQLSNSLGLYSAWGTGLSGSSVDWSIGTMSNHDYKNIDWSMTSTPYSSSVTGRNWGLSSGLASLKLSEDFKQDSLLPKKRSFHSKEGIIGLASDSNDAHDVWINSGTKGSSTILGLQDTLQGDIGNLTPSGFHEWTSPFTGKDLFTAHHLLVPSPLL